MQQVLPRKDVVLLGIGHTNAHILRMWRMKPIPDARLTCISNFSIATYSGMLPGVLAGQYPPERMEIDLARLCAAAGARLIVAEVKGLDIEARELLFEDRPPLRFDVLSIGVGSVPRFDGVDPASPLARLLYEADYLGKSLLHRPELASRIPGYKTEYAFDAGRPGAASTTRPRRKRTLSCSSRIRWTFPQCAHRSAPDVRSASLISRSYAGVVLTNRFCPPSAADGPLANRQRPLAGAAYLNWAGLLEAARPWIDYGFDQAGNLPVAGDLPAAGDEAAKQGVKDHIHAVLAFLQCLRTMSSASYFEQGALVTHSEWRLEDQK